MKYLIAACCVVFILVVMLVGVYLIFTHVCEKTCHQSEPLHVYSFEEVPDYYKINGAAILIDELFYKWNGERWEYVPHIKRCLICGR